MSSPEASVEEALANDASVSAEELGDAARSAENTGPSDTSDTSAGTNDTTDTTDARRARLNAPVAARDEAKLGLVIVRDVAVVAALLSLFAAAEAWALTSGLGLARLLSTLDGLLVGAAVAGLAHEWGHFAGARLGGGHAPLKPFAGLLPLFDFDYRNNSARAFDWMSIGGNAANISVALALFVLLPLETSGTVALVAGAIGFSVFAAKIEFPVIRKARAGMTGAQALGTLPRDFSRRATRWGVAAAGVAFLLL